MNELASQKALLIAESELNRAHLVHDLATLTDDVRSLTDHASGIGSLTASAVGLVAGLLSVQRGSAAPASGRGDWWQMLLRGSSVLGAFWRMWNPSHRHR